MMAYSAWSPLSSLIFSIASFSSFTILGHSYLDTPPDVKIAAGRPPNLKRINTMPHASTPALLSRLRKKASVESKAPKNAGCTVDGSMNVNVAKSSPASPRRRASVRHLYSSPSASRSSPQLNARSSSAATMGNPIRAASIKRWDGNRRTTTVWDCLRRDPELWFPTGDCYVHFCQAGQSRRGASLQISLADIEVSNCGPLLELCRPLPFLEFSSSAASTSSSEGELFDVQSATVKYEIYVPAPAHLTREDAFRYHLTTRNFFAWMFDLPIVGHRLGEALVALLDRMNVYRLDKLENQEELLAYLDSQEYTDFRECPDHSLAILHFAERFELRDLWTDAFVHSAGMNENLILSGEFESISRTSKALITRAYLEMSVRLERAGKSLASFLDEDLSCTFGNDARIALERFRTFLHSFYVGKFGYWPPAPPKGFSNALPKSTYRSMYFEFRKLYEYLVDPLSSNSIQDNKPADGGLCVLQNIKAFDKRHKIASLPHPLPLVPEIPRSLGNHKSSKMLRLFGNRQAKSDRRTTEIAALSAATNPGSLAVMECPLVRDYLQFEKIWTMKGSEKLSCAEARKVRWILIYAILQTLISVTRAPTEVRDTEGVSYPLCCQIAGTPPWGNGLNASKAEEKQDALSTKSTQRNIEIEPDVYYSLSNSSQLIVNTNPPIIPFLPRKVSVGQDLSLMSPQPRRASVCDILFDESNENTHAVVVDSDSSTPSSAAGTAGSVRWSLSSSEDGMEHASVSENDSVYGDHDEERVYSKDCRVESAIRVSLSSFRPNVCNPEVDQYIRS